MYCTDLINVLIFCFLPLYSFESCSCSVLKMGTFSCHLVPPPMAVLFSENSCCLGSFKQLCALPQIMPCILNMIGECERLNKVWTVKATYQICSCSPGWLQHSYNDLKQRWILKNIIISKPVTVVRLIYNDVKDHYGNNG